MVYSTSATSTKWLIQGPFSKYFDIGLFIPYLGSSSESDRPIYGILHGSLIHSKVLIEKRPWSMLGCIQHRPPKMSRFVGHIIALSQLDPQIKEY